MLSREDNELLTRVGPGTPTGALLRCFWQPFALSSELPHADSDPIRVRLLGEDLIAFRDSNGAVGLLQNNCPHRGASLFFGRNEEAGLRCVYHGWKFSTDVADWYGRTSVRGARRRRCLTWRSWTNLGSKRTASRSSAIATGSRRSRATSTPRTRASSTGAA